MRFKLISAFAALALAAGLAQAQTKLKFAHVYETSEPYHTQALWAAGEIAKRTNNRYAVEVFPASTLGKETDINQGLTLGTVDIIYTGQLFAGRTYGPLAIGGRAVHVPRLRPLEGLRRTARCSTNCPTATARRAGATRWSPSRTTASATSRRTRRSTSQRT